MGTLQMTIGADNLALLNFLPQARQTTTSGATENKRLIPQVVKRKSNWVSFSTIYTWVRSFIPTNRLNNDSIPLLVVCSFASFDFFRISFSPTGIAHGFTLSHGKSMLTF